MLNKITFKGFHNFLSIKLTISTTVYCIYLQDSFLTMPFVYTTRLGNKTYRMCCSMNHFQQHDQNILLFTFYRSGFHSGKFDRSTCEKHWKMTISAFLVIFCTRRSGTILDESHQDIRRRKLRKLGKFQERDESVLHLAHAQPNFKSGRKQGSPIFKKRRQVKPCKLSPDITHMCLVQSARTHSRIQVD